MHAYTILSACCGKRKGYKLLVNVVSFPPPVVSAPRGDGLRENRTCNITGGVESARDTGISDRNIRHESMLFILRGA